MGDHQPQNKKMRCSILFLSLAIIYASASPVDEVVPEESLYALDDDLSEARSTIEQMTTAGKSDKDCRKLVEETRKEVQTNVDTCTKTMDALPKGEACPAKGQSAVKAATEAKSKADQLVITTKTAVTKAESASVSFGSRTFSSLTEGKCESFYTSTSYTTAETTYKSSVTAYTKATGAAAKEKAECECAVKKDHESKFSTLTKANAANEKAWNFACKVECVLDGKTTCKCSAAPKCVRPKVTSAVMEAVCVAKKVVVKNNTPELIMTGQAKMSGGVITIPEGSSTAYTKKSYKRPLTVSVEMRMTDHRTTDECGVAQIFGRNNGNGRHSGYSFGDGWWGKWYGWGANSAQGYKNFQGNQATSDGNIREWVPFKVDVNKDGTINFAARGKQYAQIKDTRYNSGPISLGHNCRKFEYKNLRVTEL